jgi:RNA polymerase sigma-70 factor (ECF subfamily)
MTDAETAPAEPYERHRAYLRVLAQTQLPAHMRGKLDASEVVQDALLEAHTAAGQFRGSTEPEYRAWLRTILARKLTDAVRHFGRLKRDVAREVSIEASLHDSACRLEAFLAAQQTGPSTDAARREQVLQLAGALERLPEDQRLAVELHHLQGCPLADAAQRMGRTKASVAGLLRRGLKQLREELARLVEPS